MRPVIGIPCNSVTRPGSNVVVYGNNQSYVRAVQRAGGVALLIPAGHDADAIEEICSRLDGLLLSGGCDIDPERYGEERIVACQAPDPERDELELALAAWALDAAAPILGICRGMQLLNVACGGTLYQDLETQQPAMARHDQADYRAHLSRARDSSSATLAAERDSGAAPYAVNSLHHQAVAQPGERVEIVGWSPDGVAEAMEVDGHPLRSRCSPTPKNSKATLSSPTSRAARSSARLCRRAASAWPADRAWRHVSPPPSLLCLVPSSRLLPQTANVPVLDYRT